ncbi:MAG: class I SAM-dependent methyltransferase [Chloroflexota bacterium]
MDPGRLPCCGPAFAELFDEREARHDLEAYRKSGPAAATRQLIGALTDAGVEDAELIDIGAGVGAIFNGLLDAGAARALDVDYSAAFIEAAREESARRGHADRVEFRFGDFVQLAPGIEAADVVTLDRVICCYPNARALIGLSAARARQLYGIVAPVDAWWTRGGARALNWLMWVTRRRMRFYVHRRALVDGLLTEAGFASLGRQRAGFWEITTYRRSR